MTRRTVVTIGNFDGVHLGHQAIVGRARELAQRHRAAVVVLTFDPHPAAVLRPGRQPPGLMQVRQRVARLMAAGADQVNLLRPTAEVLDRSPARFVEGLVAEFAPVAIVEGPGFRFGKDRAGDLGTLAELGRTHGFAVEAVEAVEAVLGDLSQVPVSSSLVRWLVGRGRVADAAICLGRPFQLLAPVVRGEQRGRQIGVPTANLDLDALEGQILPADGVYAGTAVIGGTDDGARFPAAISVGRKPTFSGRRLTVEAHLLGYRAADPDAMYGQTVAMNFARWLRDQYPFPDGAALGRQLRRDIDRVAAAVEPGPGE